MKSRCVKPMLVLVLLGLGLAFVAGSATARPNMLDFQVIGTGTAGGACQLGVLATDCTSNSGGEAIGKHIGFGTYTLSLTAGTAAAMNLTGGICLPANSLGDTITAANGDTITFKTVGWLCEEGIPGSPYHYSGTYRIDGGSGRFLGATGSGNVAATFVKGLGGLTNVKFDGTIDF